MKIHLLAILASFAVQGGVMADTHLKIQGTGQAAIEGSSAVAEKPDVTMEVRIDNAVVAVTDATNKAADAKERGEVPDSSWARIKASLKEASRQVDQAKDEYYKDNEPVKALQHLQEAEGILAQLELSAE